jgi:hypothetical protein
MVARCLGVPAEEGTRGLSIKTGKLLPRYPVLAVSGAALSQSPKSMYSTTDYHVLGMYTGGGVPRHIGNHHSLSPPQYQIPLSRKNYICKAIFGVGTRLGQLLEAGLVVER